MLGTATLVAGTAPISTATLQVPGAMLDGGSNSLVAVFPGDGANDAASSSTAVSVTVTGSTANAKTTPTVALRASAASVFIQRSAATTVTQSAILTAALSPIGPTGTVQFFLGTTSLGTGVVSGGTATLTIDSSVLALGKNNLTATYSGDVQYTTATTTTPAVVSLLNSIVNFGSVALGNSSPAQQFTVTFLAARSVGLNSSLTLGGVNKDYLDGGTTNCSAKSYAPLATCTLSLKYMPGVPGTRLGSIVLYDQNSVPITTIAATGTGLAPLLSFGFAAPTAITSNFNGPSSVSMDGTGNMFVADTMNDRVAEIPIVGVPKNAGIGFVYPVGTAVDGAGNLYVADAVGITMVPNENGNLNAAHQVPLAITGGVFFPEEIAFDSLGNLFIADSFNNRIVRLASVNGVLDLLHPTYPGTGLTGPMGVAVDASGNLFIADTGFLVDAGMGIYGRIVEIPAITGIQKTLPINNLNAPSSIAIDASGELYVADTDNMRIVQVSPDMSVQTALNLSINAPNPQYFAGLALDLKGNVWAADFGNNQIIQLAQSTPNFDMGAFTPPGYFGPVTLPVSNIGSSILNIFSFNPPAYFSQSGGTCLPGSLIAPGQNCTLSIAYNNNGNYFQGATGSFNVLDNVKNQTVAGPHIDPIIVWARMPVTVTVWCSNANSPYGVDYTCGANAYASSGASATGLLHYVVDGVPFDIAFPGGNVGFIVSKPHAGTHTMVVSYATQGVFAASQPVTEYFTVTPAPTQIALVPSSWYMPVGSTLTLSVTNTSWSAGSPTTGTVIFYDGNVVVGTGPVNTNGSATLALSNLTVGMHNLSAQFSGNADFATVTSAVAAVEVH